MKDEAREERIDMEIVVDAYGEGERAIGWHCYLQDSITFLFKAECLTMRKTSPLRQGDECQRARNVARRCLHERDFCPN